MKMLKFYLKFYFLFSLWILGNSTQFNRKLTGVVFSPYVKQIEGTNRVPSYNSYTLKNVKTMLEVVATKFSRVMTRTVGASTNRWSSYAPNETYYYDCTIIARTAEAAAFINHERKFKALTVFVGIFLPPFPTNDNVLESEVLVALEAVHKANSIYPGTVEGIVFSSPVLQNLRWYNLTLSWMIALRHRIATLAVKIGTEQSIFDLSTYKPNENDRTGIELWELREKIIEQSDFIICKLYHNVLARWSTSKDWDIIKVIASRYRHFFKQIKPDIEVMIETRIENGKNETSFMRMMKWWGNANQFATTEKLLCWFDQAFDDDDPVSLTGWWKLSKNVLIDTPDGYVEKISGKPVHVNRPRTPLIVPTSLPTLTTRLTSSSQHPEGKKDITFFRTLFGATSGLLAVVMAISVLLYIVCKRRKHRERQTLTSQEIHEFLHGLGEDRTSLLATNENINTLALKFPYDKSLEIPKGKLDIFNDQVLGEGQYGRVFKAIIKKSADQEVALKMLKADSPTTALKGFLSEIKILSYLGQHPNIVAICGAYTAEIQKCIVYIALELCPLGSLHKFLLNCQNAVKEKARISWNKYYATIAFHDGIPYKDMIRWAFEIASGMEYLSQKNVVHADLATRNVLLSSDSTAKITDFGLSRRLYEYRIYTKQTQEPLPWRSMAVETLKSAQFSVQSDVWSYGVTLWEIYSLGDMPFPIMSWSFDFVEQLENGLRLKQPQYAGPELYKIMSDCWQYQPENRPTFAQLKDLTRSISETYFV